MKKTIFLDRALILRFVFDLSRKNELEDNISELLKGYECILFEPGSMSGLRNKVDKIGAFAGKLLPLHIDSEFFADSESVINLNSTIRHLSNQIDILHAFENFKSISQSHDGTIANSLGYIYRLLLISAKFKVDILIWEPRFQILKAILQQLKIDFTEIDIRKPISQLTISEGEALKLTLKPIEMFKKEVTFISSKEMTEQKNATPIIVILTAIKEEYLAVRSHLLNIREIVQNGTYYERGLFIYKEKVIANVIIRECGPKNNIAAQETERAIQYFQPNCMFFVGIAGSRKPMDFEIGDVIFAEKIYSYEAGKSSESNFYARPDLESCSFILLEKAKQIRLQSEWKSLIKGNYNKEVKADTGTIASGEKIVEHYNSSIGSILKEHYNDTAVVEMEGFGFAKAAKRQGGSNNSLLIGVVRGISDILENSKLLSEDLNLDKRPTNAKIFASDTASAFTYWLILKTFERTK